ncbi:hypothetical protein AK812_SmicGene40519 [Symbiodinium microadriaticum]|uniref:Uncharacterized protein n=1 Tax=Symbiodinium microadriaticum TaxID=2951 RepID=A0A1Q9C8M2_SYMMI|nr:hypothetical protein AK812_SmicGene40519 [Symbiodinium microadriaticum]
MALPTANAGFKFFRPSADADTLDLCNNFVFLHRFGARDLPVIRNELGANALLLAPWSFGHRSHTQFLEQATANNLKVIPSFDLSWYWEDGRWGSDLATRAALRKDFHDFLQYSALIQEDARLSTPESILLWNLEGLPSVEAILPRSCVAGALTDVANFRNCIASSGDLVDALNTVQTIQESRLPKSPSISLEASSGPFHLLAPAQDMLQVVREAQREFHCEEGAQRAECAARDDVPVFKFDRPLALTIDLGDVYLSVAENSEYLAAFVFWMERVVGCHPVAVGQAAMQLLRSETDCHEELEEKLQWEEDDGFQRLKAEELQHDDLETDLIDQNAELQAEAKEAETVKLPDFPIPETYRSWTFSIREAVRATSDKPAEAFKWVQEVYERSATLESFWHTGKFLTLDSKILLALSRVAKEELARQAINCKAVRGRQVLLMLEHYFKTNEEAGYVEPNQASNPVVAKAMEDWNAKNEAFLNPKPAVKHEEITEEDKMWEGPDIAKAEDISKLSMDPPENS